MSTIASAPAAAQHFGISIPQLTRDANACGGRVGRGSYDLDKIRAYRERKAIQDGRTLQRTAEVAARGTPGRVGPARAAAITTDDNTGTLSEPSSSVVIELQALKVRQQRALTEQRELAARRAAGELCSLEAAKAVYSRILSNARTRLEAMGTRLSPECVGRTKIEIEGIIHREALAVLAELTRGLDAEKEIADAWG